MTLPEGTAALAILAEEATGAAAELPLLPDDPLPYDPLPYCASAPTARRRVLAKEKVACIVTVRV